MQKNSKPITAVILIFLAFVLFYHLFWAKFGLTFSDEGHFLYSAQLINEGELPYRDYWIEQTPGSFYLQSLIFKITGASIMAGRLSMVALAIIICLLMFIISRKLAPFPYSLIPAVIYCFWGISQINIPWYSHYALFFCLLGAYFLSNYINRKKLIWAFYSGLAIGMCVLMKQNLGAACFLGTNAFLLLEKIICARTNQLNTWSSLLKKIFTLSVGAAIPFFVMVGIYYKYNALHNLFYHVFGVAWISTKTRLSLKLFPDIELPSITILTSYLWLVASLYFLLTKRLRRFSITAVIGIIIIGLTVAFTPKLQQWHNVRHYFAFGVISAVFNIPAICLLTGLFSFISWFKKLKPLEGNANVIFLFVVIYSSCYFLTSLILGRDYIHIVEHIAPCFLPLAFIAFKSDISLQKKFGYKNAVFFKICLIAIPILLVAIRGAFASANNEIQYVESLPKYKMDYKIEKVPRAKGIYIEEEKGRQVEALINYLQAVTAKDDYIFLFSSGQMIYFLAERRHPYIQTFFHDEIFYKENQPVVIEKIKEKNVRYVVIWNEKTNLSTWAQDEDCKYRLISKFLLDNYRTLKDFGRFSVWEKKNPFFSKAQ